MKTTTFVVGLFVLASAPALAKNGPTTTIELQFGDYRPDIDSGFTSVDGSTLTGPYAASFAGERTTMVMINWERNLSRALGSLSFGIGVGYWSVEGQAVSPTGTASDAEDTTALDILPLQVQLTYRFDIWAESLALVPVARAGVDYYLWQVLDGSGDVAYFDPTHEAKGGTYGYHTTFGVHLLLDALSPKMAGDFERNAGVYNSYLTFEYRLSSIDDFASATSFRLGDETFVVGLALDL